MPFLYQWLFGRQLRAFPTFHLASLKLSVFQSRVVQQKLLEPFAFHKSVDFEQHFDKQFGKYRQEVDLHL